MAVGLMPLLIFQSVKLLILNSSDIYRNASPDHQAHELLQSSFLMVQESSLDQSVHSNFSNLQQRLFERLLLRSIHPFSEPASSKFLGCRDCLVILHTFLSIVKMYINIFKCKTDKGQALMYPTFFQMTASSATHRHTQSQRQV